MRASLVVWISESRGREVGPKRLCLLKKAMRRNYIASGWRAFCLSGVRLTAS